MLSAKASATTHLITRWTRFWNSYDLDELEALFVMDEQGHLLLVREAGPARGPEALRRHHISFGFVPGGKVSTNGAWLEQIAEDRLDRGTTLITAIWCFRRASAPDVIQRGPLSAVVVHTRHGPQIPTHELFDVSLGPQAAAASER